ncbi:MAG: glycosyltransferase family 4 protein [Phycisphaerae bacterium]|jgi:glycosyltransferase involved in cell wall biosynthesis
MKVLVLYDYPPSPGGLASQGDLLYKGLKDLGIEAYSVNFESAQEKEWYYNWFKPDAVVGIGYWGHSPHLVLHPQQHGMMPVPWLVADGYIANYRDALENLPLILVTSQWVKQVYIRDGMSGKNIEVLPVGCDTDSFCPRDKNDPKVSCIRKSLGVAEDELMILTVGGDAASKGGQEVMQALAAIRDKVPAWKYVCKVWPQPRTEQQNALDFALAKQLGIDDKMIYAVNKISRNFMPYLISACDIYAAPSRLEGFGMIQVEANACEKPVIGINAMGLLDTMIHAQTAYLAGVAKEITIAETTVGVESGFEPNTKIKFEQPRIVDYRASSPDIAKYLLKLMNNPDLCKKMGQAGRKRVVDNFNYKVVAKKFVEIVQRKLNIN